MPVDIPHELVEQFARGNGVIFVGSGLSQGAGLPKWDNFIKSNLATEINGCPPGALPRDIAQYYEIEYGRNRLVQKLRDQLDTLDVQPTSAHKMLVNLPVSAIFTTNYDDLLERALRLANRPFAPVVGKVDASFWSVDRLQLVKLHGDINRSESIVITAEDYERFATQRPTLTRLLATTLQTRTVLFMGYNATDPDLRLILTQMRDESGEFARNLYTVQFGAPKLMVKGLERRGLKVVDLKAQPDDTARNAELHEWLQTLKQQVMAEVHKLKPVISQEPRTAVEMLAGEIRIWLNAMGYTMTSQPRDSNCMDLEALLQWGLEEQHILVRCIAGEITVQRLEALEQDIAARGIPKGWAVSDRYVPLSAQSYTNDRSTIRALSLSNFVSQIFSPYFAWLRELVEDSDILRYYVDLSCYRRVLDKDGNEINRDHYQVIDSYVNDWLKARDANHLSILGDSGAGKTWFCRHYAYKQLERYLNDPVHERLPILITLRDYVKQVEVGSLIRKLLDERGVQLRGGLEAFEELNRHGKLLLIFDGFDEMALKVDYQIVVDYFWELADMLKPGSKALLTCRTGYFRYATEAEKVMHGGELGRKMIVIEPPKFEIVSLEPLTEKKVREVITRRRGPDIADFVLEKPKLKVLAQQPVIIEILMEALPDIQPDIEVNLSEVYCLAVNRWLERDISTGRTFMDKWDKMFFMMELAWEMISTDKPKLHYKELPDRIARHFELEKRSEMDHYDYDIRTKSFLRRDTDGHYEFMHKSLAEYFVALKFALDLGGAAPEYISDISCTSESQSPDNLRDTFGSQPLTKMPEIGDFLAQMIDDIEPLERAIGKTRAENFGSTKYIGGNAVSVLKRLDYSFRGFDFSNTVLVEADFTGADLTNANFQGADMRRAEMRFTVYDGKELDGEALRKYVHSSPLFKDANLEDIDWHITWSYDTRSWRRGCFPAGTLIKMSDGMDKPIEKIQIGNRVLSYCVETESYVEGSVVRTFVGETFSYVVINENLMITPSENLFTGHKWLKAYQLSEGDRLITPDGEILIQKIKRVQQRVSIFNLVVHPYHNFFAADTLVHNWPYKRPWW